MCNQTCVWMVSEIPTFLLPSIYRLWKVFKIHTNWHFYHLNTGLVRFSDPHCVVLWDEIFRSYDHPTTVSSSRWIGLRSLTNNEKFNCHASPAFKSFVSAAFLSMEGQTLLVCQKYKPNIGEAGFWLEVCCQGKYQSFVTFSWFWYGTILTFGSVMLVGDWLGLMS